MTRLAWFVPVLLLFVSTAAAKDPASRRADRVKKILARLEAGTERYRVTALRVLGEIGDESCLDAVSKQLAAKEDAVREEAARCLGRLRIAGSTGRLLPLVNDRSMAVGRAAVWALGELRDASALQEMDKLFQKHRELRPEFAIAYGKIGDKRMKGVVESVLKGMGEHDLARPHVAAALARLSPSEGLAILQKDFKAKDADTGFFIAYESAMALGETDLVDAAKFLLGRLDRLQPRDPLDVIIREAVVSGIGNFRNDKAIEHFIKHGLKDLKDFAMVASVARGLGLTRSPLAVTPLRELLPMKSPKGDDETYEVRRAALLALGDLGDPSTLDAVKPFVDAPDPRIQVAALEAIGGIGAEEGVAIAAAKISAPDPQVRFAAAEALFRIRSEASIPPLIDLLGTSKEWLQREAWSMLRRLTGKDFGTKAEDWKGWWAKSKEGFEVLYEEDLEDLQGTTLFWGIEVTSKRVIFAIDVSGSMAEPARQMPTVVTGQEAKEEEIGPMVSPAEKVTKIGVAKDELLKTLSRLPNDTMFDVLVFNGSVDEWKKVLVQATKENKKKCNVEFVQPLRPEGATNINDTLEKAFEMAGEGVVNPKADLKVDTIFLMTDGTPTAGKVIEPERILENVRRLNKLRRVRIHCVGVGQCNSDLLEKLASENGGRFVRPDLGQR